MVDFGFGILEEQKIDLDKAQNRLFLSIATSRPEILTCIGCGSCTATCSAGFFSKCGFRPAILMLERGMEQEGLSMVKSCILCGKCSLVCPRGINTRRILMDIHNSILGKV